jgi:glycolate oxidase iron-sulfur subunit
MQHEIPVDRIGPAGPAMRDAIAACVHCGFCLPSCPTYQELGQEMDSPRGRIYLMKEVLEGKLDPARAQPHIDRCLGCLACVSSCPSGVAYQHLLSPYRAYVKPSVKRPLLERLRRHLAMQVIPYPGRFRLALRGGRLLRRLDSCLPAALRPMLRLLPGELPPALRLRARYPAQGQRRARVALLAGCAQQVLAPAINRATIEVLTRNGVEVIVPPLQGCCGALAWHSGEAAQARRQARRTLRHFAIDVDAVIVNAAGCGSGMHEYPLLLRGDPAEAAAQSLAGRVVDIAVFLDRLGIEPPPAPPRPLRIAYHDACHLSHGQQVRAAPRRLLSAIPDVELVELHDGERCCGSAGIYNLEQPEIAGALGARKAAAVHATACDLLATGNIGCIAQIRAHLAAPHAPAVLHTIEVLAAAYAGSLAPIAAHPGVAPSGASS